MSGNERFYCFFFEKGKRRKGYRISVLCSGFFVKEYLKVCMKGCEELRAIDTRVERGQHFYSIFHCKIRHGLGREGLPYLVGHF